MRKRYQDAKLGICWGMKIRAYQTSVAEHKELVLLLDRE
jgi:hypothetical protein